MRLDLDGENVENSQHFPTQQNHGNDGNRDCQEFAKIQIAAAGLEASCHQAKNVQRGEAKNQYPKNVVDIALLAG
jgi:hypothetical protein